MPRIVDKVGDWYYFPLGVAYVSAALKEQKFNVVTLNLNNIEGDIVDIIRDTIERDNIDVVSTGGLTFQFNSIRNILEAVKAIDANIPIIVGGGIITSAPEVAMKALEYADYGIIGEGEITSCVLSKVIEENGSIEDVQGIIYRDGNKYIQTTARPEINDLDSLPYPDYKGFGFDKILTKVASLQGINEKNTITMLSSRSCPYKCTFCFHSSGKKYRQRSLDNFFKEVDFLVKEYSIKYIFIADELFAHNMDRVKEFCRRIKEYDIKWWAQFRVTDITKELVTLLKQSNCVTMGFGIESADNRILKSMRKAITVKQIENALELVYDSGIGIQGGLIFGDVEETLETAQNTLNWWKENNRYGLSLNFISIYPGTPLYKHAVEKNIIHNEVEFIKDGCPIINVSKMNKEERQLVAKQVIELPQEELLEPCDLSNIEINYTGGTISLNGNCVSCNSNTQWTNIRFFTRNVLQCCECGRKHKVPVLQEIVDQIDLNLSDAIAKYGKIACWGVNDYFSDIVRLSNILKDSNILFVDKSEFKQGCKIGGKEILSPEIIYEKDIEYVIIPVVSLYPVIYEEIKLHYKNVLKVKNILELLI